MGDVARQVIGDEVPDAANGGLATQVVLEQDLAQADRAAGRHTGQP